MGFILGVILTVLVIYSALVTVLYIHALLEYSPDATFVEYRKRRAAGTLRKKPWFLP